MADLKLTLMDLLSPSSLYSLKSGDEVAGVIPMWSCRKSRQLSIKSIVSDLAIGLLRSFSVTQKWGSVGCVTTPRTDPTCMLVICLEVLQSEKLWERKEQRPLSVSPPREARN